MNTAKMNLTEGSNNGTGFFLYGNYKGREVGVYEIPANRAGDTWEARIVYNCGGPDGTKSTTRIFAASRAKVIKEAQQMIDWGQA